MPGAADDFKLSMAAAAGSQGGLISLHSGDPGTTGANEINGGGYTRQTTTWGSPSIISGGPDDGKAQIVGAPVNFNVPATTITHYSVRKADGSVLYSQTLDASVTFNTPGICQVTPRFIFEQQ